MYSTIVPYVNLSGGCGYFIFLIDTKISKFCHGISPTVHRFHQLLFSEIFKNIQMFCSFLFKAMHSHISYNFHFISASEIFPKDLYTIYRKDRTGRKRGGGVLLAISTDILSSEQPELDTDCEIIWAKVDIIGVNSIYIGAYYKPQENDIESINELSRSLQRIPKQSYLVTW
jgi:hypothetical protein